MLDLMNMGTLQGIAIGKEEEELKTEKMKAEAVRRMKQYRMHPNVVREFNEGKLNESEHFGMLYWLNEKEEQMIKKWENETGNLVYHVVHQWTNIGELYTCLYVSRYEEEWEYDWEDMKKGYQVCHVINITDSKGSESGSCGIEMQNGGLVRTW